MVEESCCQIVDIQCRHEIIHMGEDLGLIILKTWALEVLQATIVGDGSGGPEVTIQGSVRAQHLVGSKEEDE